MNISVIYSCSDVFAKYAYISMWSLFKSNTSIEDISVYLIEDGITNLIAFEKLAIEYNRKLEIMSITTINYELKDAKQFFNSKATYAKLLASKVCKEDKIIYIDADTLITKSLSEMWSVDITDYLIAGVQDCLQDFHLEAIGMNVNDRYVNGGVLILNLKKWREVNLENSFLEYISSHNGDLPNVDQGIINGVCKGQILILDPKYNTIPQLLYYRKSDKIKKLYNINNYYNQKQIDEAISHPVIIHFIRHFYDRPWNKGCMHPYKNMFREYIKHSHFDKNLEESSLKRSVKIRRLVYRYMPFRIFYMLEKKLDYKRKYTLNKIYLKRKH